MYDDKGKLYYFIILLSVLFKCSGKYKSVKRLDSQGSKRMPMFRGIKESPKTPFFNKKTLAFM